MANRTQNSDSGNCLFYILLFGVIAYIADLYKKILFYLFIFLLSLLALYFLFRIIRHILKTSSSERGATVPDTEENIPRVTAESSTIESSPVPIDELQSNSETAILECPEDHSDTIEKNDDTRSCSINYNITPIDDNVDPYFEAAGKFIIEKERASVGMIQRMFKIGFNRAVHIMDQLCDAEVVAAEEGTKPRKILMTLDEFEYYIEKKNFSTVFSPTSSLQDMANYSAEEALLSTTHILSDEFNISVSYEQDGKYLYRLNNIIVPRATEEVQFNFINNLIRFNSPLTTKLLIYDSTRILYSAYNILPHLIIPVVTEKTKVHGIFIWAISEMETRIQSFLASGVKNIDSYNQKVDSWGLEKLPKIVIIIDECYNIPKEENENLTQLLLNSVRTGIYTIIFSKLDKKRLYLGRKGDLLETYTQEQLDNLFI